MTLPTPASSLSSAPLLPDHEPSLQASPSPRKSANPSANPSPLQQLLAAPDKLGLQSPPLPSPPSQVDMLSTSDMVVMANSSLDSTALATSEGDNHSLVAATAAGPTSPWLTPPQDSASSLLDSTSSNTDGNALSNPSQSSSNSSSSNNSSSSSHSNNGQNGSNPNGSITSSSSSSSSSNSSDSAAGSASSSSNSSPPMEASASALSVLDGLLGVNPLAEPSISELSAALSADAAHLLPPIGEGPLNLSSLLADDSAPLDASALPLAAGDMLGALLTAPADEADPLASFLGTASTSVADDDAASLTTSSALLSAAATGLEANSANAGTDSLEDIMFSIMDETVGGPPSALDAAMLGVEGSLASSTADFLAAAAQYAAVTAASAPPPMFGGPATTTTGLFQHQSDDQYLQLSDDDVTLDDLLDMVPTQEALNDRMQMLVEQQKELERRHADLLATTRSNHVRHVREHLEKLANDRNLRLAGTRRRRPNVHPAAPSHFSDEDSDIESHHDVPSMLFKQNRRPASIVTARGKAVERRLIRRSYKRVRTMENAANDPDATDESGDETDVETLIAGKSRHQTVRVDRLFVHPPLELVHTSSFQRALDKARANLPAVPLTTRHSETDRIATESVLQNAAAQYIGARRTAALTHLTESHKVLWRWRWLERQVQLLDEMLVVDRAALAALESNNDVSAVLAAADEAIGAADDQSRDVVQSAMVVENAAAAAVSEATDTDAGAAHAMRTELIANLGGHRSTLVRRHRGMAMLPSGSTPAKQQQQQPAHPASSPLKAGGVNSELCRAPQVMARPFSEKIAQLDQDFHPVLSFSTDMSPEMNFAPFNMAITRAHMQQLYSQQQSQEAIAFSAATRPSALNHAAAAAAFVNSMQGSSSAGPSVPDSQHVVQSLEHQQQELEALQQRLVQATASLASGRSSEFDPAVVAQQLAQYKQSLQQLQFANNGSSSSEHDPMMTEDGGFAAPAALKNQRTTSTSLPGSVSRARTNSFSSTSLPPASYATPPRLGGNSRRPSSSARPSSLASSFPSSPLGAGSAFGSPAPGDPNSPFVAPAAARKRRHMDDWDFDNMIVPQSTARIERIQYKEILTPSWRSDTVVPSKNGASSEVAGNEPVSASETPSDKTPGDAVPSNVAPAAAAASAPAAAAADEEHEEDLSDEAYARMHQALEIAERRRFLNFVNLRDQTGRPGDAAGSSGTAAAAAAPRPSGGSMGFAAISLRQVQLQQQTAASSASESPGDSSSDVPAASPSGSHQLRGVNRKVEAAIELFGNVEALARNYVQHFSAADFQAQSQFEPRSFPMTRAQFEQVLTENNAIESQLMNERLRYEEAYRASPQWSERPHYFYYDHIQTIHGRQQPLPFVAAPGFMAGHVMAGGLSHSNGYAVKTEDNDSDSPDDEDEDDEEEDDEPQRANHADDELEVENANDSHDDQDEDNRDAENDDGDDSDDDEDDEDDEAPSASSNHRHAVGEDSDDDYSVSTPRKRDRRPRPARARASAPPVPATSADVAPPSGPPVKTVLILKLGKSVIRKDLSDTPASAASDALPMTE